MKILFATLLVSLFCISCSPNNNTTENVMITNDKIEVPDWAKNANIYEVNIRQYTEEGTFTAFQKHLQRLNDMGVKILWFMPIHPISKEKRKGIEGSYYAVSDFRAINPAFGSMADFDFTVEMAHSYGMKVLIDWVPHHTGWDHVWITSHPEYFSKDSLGNIIDPINEETGEPWGWTDVAELDLSNKEMRKSIIEDMRFWVEDHNIDGFRVDHAHGVPDDYWDEVSASLAQIDKPIFMLAEGEETWLRNDSNFVMTYAWKMHHVLNDIAQGHKTVNAIDSILADERSNYTYGYSMQFITNHDENSWAGTEMERMGDGHKAFAVLTMTLDGMPLIYSGQEEPLTKRLEFFERDPIPWDKYSYNNFFKTLLDLKTNNKALWNGKDGGLSHRINTSDDVYAFHRVKDYDELVAIFNLSDKPHQTSINIDVKGFTNVFENRNQDIVQSEVIHLKPWEYLVLSKTN